LPFLLTCKAAWGLRDAVLLPFSISPLGPNNRTPLMAAVIHNNVTLVHSMCKFSKGSNLDSKVFYCHAIKVPRFGYGCIEEMDSTEQQHGGTALTVAASNGHGAIVDELLSAGASPSLALTFEYGRKDIHKLLFAQRSEVRKIFIFNSDEDWSSKRLKEILRYEHVDLIPTTYSSSMTQQQVERRLREVLSGRWLRFNGGCDGYGYSRGRRREKVRRESEGGGREGEGREGEGRG